MHRWLRAASAAARTAAAPRRGGGVLGDQAAALSSAAPASPPAPPRRQRPIYVAATRQHVGKTSVSLALVAHFARRRGSAGVGYMKAVGQESRRVWDGPAPGEVGPDGEEGGHVIVDKDVQLIRDHFRLDHLRYADMSPVLIPRGYTMDYLDGKIEGQLADIRNAYLNIVRRTSADDPAGCVTICEGTGHIGVGSIVGLGNARVAAELGADVVLVVNGGLGKAFDELELNRALCLQHGVNIAGVVVNKVDPAKYDQTRDYLAEALRQFWTVDGRPAPPLLGVVPDRPYLGSPALADLESAFGSVLLSGSDHRYRHYDVGANVQGRDSGMNMITTDLAAFLRLMRRQPESGRGVFICHASRDDIVLGFLGEYMHRKRQGVPFQSSLVVCAGCDDGNVGPNSGLSPTVHEMIADAGPAGPPVLVAEGVAPAEAAKRIRTMTPKFNADDEGRVARAVEHYGPYLDFDLLLERTGGATAREAAAPTAA